MVDNDEFDAIYVKYKGQIHRFCYLKLGSVSMGSELAEEAANDVFMALWEHWDELDRGEKLRAWLYKTAQNVVLNKLRTERRRAPQDYIEDFAVQDKLEGMSVSDEYFAADLDEKRFAEHMKTKLTDEEYSLFLERFVRKRTYDAISKQSGVPYSTVRLRSLTLERKLREELKAYAASFTSG